MFEHPSSNAKLKLCDFGFGQIVEPSVKLTATLGSLYYVAPEILKNKGYDSGAVDLWSVRVIPY